MSPEKQNRIRNNMPVRIGGGADLSAALRNAGGPQNYNKGF
jgi:hypothetical protein